MTAPKPQILIMDSTTARCEELCGLWSSDLQFEVVFSEGGPFHSYPSDRPITLNIVDLVGKVHACLLHQGDKHRYNNNPEIKKLIDSCERVVVFGGTGIAAKGNWPDNWFWIPRAIEGKNSARMSEWDQLAKFLSPNSSLTSDEVELLHKAKSHHFLIAIHILCQGFLAGERMRQRSPTAGTMTQTQEWWAVPLIKSAGSDLLPIISGEWGTELPKSVAQLVKWISGQLADKEVDLASLVPEVKQNIENRLAK